MKQLLLAGTAVFGLTASGLAAHATPIDFTYTGSLVDFTVPTTGTYQVTAYGAQGGTFSGAGPGGLGAEIGGDFSLTAGEILQIAVGGSGSDSDGGGGGGSFVVGPDNTPLVIAGGGGSGSSFAAAIFGPLAGQGGLTGQDGGACGPPNCFPSGGGTNGNGGEAGGSFDLTGGGGGGGGGFLTAGGDGNGVGDICCAIGGDPFPDLAGGALVVASAVAVAGKTALAEVVVTAAALEDLFLHSLAPVPEVVVARLTRA